MQRYIIFMKHVLILSDFISFDAVKMILYLKILLSGKKKENTFIMIFMLRK